jgi:dTDP-4-amino-4,6-dideoxygalactose transaminase
MGIKLNQPIKPNLEKLTLYLNQVNENGWYTNFGPLHQQLTNRLEQYLGVRNLLLVSNGTLALQVAYKTLNVSSALTTPFTFVATASSLIWQGIETAFTDIDKNTYNLCPVEVSKVLALNADIDTVVATHVYGNPCHVDAFKVIAKEQNVKLIYDAAHAFGVNINGRSVLSFGDASTLSFHATKVFHTIEGGAVIFKKKDDYERAKSLINFGICEKGNITAAGINAKLNEYQCAVGLVLLDEIDELISHRADLFTLYRDLLQGFVGVQQWHEKSSVNGSYMPIKLKSLEEKNSVERILKENDIQYRQYFSPSLDEVFCDLKVYSSKNSKETSNLIICLPLHSYMKIEDITVITNLIKKVVT